MLNLALRASEKSLNDVVWNENAKRFVRDLGIEVKREIGSLLMLLQCGVALGPPQSKSMKEIHKAAFELRVKDGKGQYRVIFVMAIKGKILIPHAFTKKSKKTSKKEIETSRVRLKEMLDEIK